MSPSFDFILDCYGREALRTWLAEGIGGSPILSGARLVDHIVGTDASYSADRLLDAAQQAGWILDLGFHPSLSQAAFAGLEGRRKVKGKPVYSYPREHTWEIVSATDAKYKAIHAFAFP